MEAFCTYKFISNLDCMICFSGDIAVGHTKYGMGFEMNLYFCNSLQNTFYAWLRRGEVYDQVPTEFDLNSDLWIIPESICYGCSYPTYACFLEA